MLLLRILFIFIAFCGVLATMRYYGKRTITRLGFLLFITVNFGIILISVFPEILNIFSRIFFKAQLPFSRFVLILIASNLLIWFSLFWLLVRNSKSERKIGLLVRKLGVNRFFAQNHDFKEFKDVIVIIPVFNEEKNLLNILERIPDTVGDQGVDILVVDDGSADNSVDIARKAGVYVAENDINMGGGLALQMGFEIARSGGAKFIATMDADGQHLPEELHVLQEKLIEKKADIIIGSRIKGNREKDSLLRYIGIFFFNNIINFISGSNISDCSNNYRFFKTGVLSQMNLIQAQYHTSEFIIEAAKLGFLIEEAPVTVLKRQSGQSKKGNNVKYAFNFAKTIIKTWWK